MAPRVGEDKVAEIRDRASLHEVISRYVALKRSGRNFMGLCPFHAEKTPSFSVSDERGFFHCFGCGESGDVFRFLMRMENLTFPEVLERLAGELGIELPKAPEQRRREESRERLLELNARAAEYFQRCLWNERTGSKARAYLATRGIDEETARRFALGYAPAEGLVRALEAAKVPRQRAEALGLVGKGARGGYYDRFRDRLMFPITDLGGKVIAFGGRILSPEAHPKYLNSPESPVFQKRRALFGIAAARDAIRERDRVVLVEGYLDAISLSQAGIRNVVAPLGTALTPEQIRLLRRFTDNVSVFFDGDEAGKTAAARSFAVFAEVGLFADAAFLPEGHDPDTFVREAGPDGVETLLAEATPLVDHYLRTLAAADAPLVARQRAGQSVAELIGRTADAIFTGLLARRAAEVLGIPEDLLLRSAKATPSSRRDAAGRPDSAASAPSSPPAPRPADVKLARADSMLLELVLVRPELRTRLPDDVASLLASDDARALLTRVLERDAELTELLDELPRELRDRVARAVAGETAAYEEAEHLLADCLARLERDRLEARIRAISDRIRDAQSRGDEAAVQRLLEEKQELARSTRTSPSGE